jgi:hypothetical protein
MTYWTQQMLSEKATASLTGEEILLGWTIRLDDDGTLIMQVEYDVWDGTSYVYVSKTRDISLLD